jgi:hypothetical protein
MRIRAVEETTVKRTRIRNGSGLHKKIRDAREYEERRVKKRKPSGRPKESVWVSSVLPVNTRAEHA